ncbi:hypothetical protein ALC57_03512 [Trachymyrmex cornetzi]|uniref:Uncharacterized protein n=1 Tax=Trachymyrmex cornetzi TaxID=471704 RepID=A0A195EH22_9HYME|nr:hypothetical protein ALC57_03512 [Trachymyrmex cornetzi]
MSAAETRIISLSISCAESVSTFPFKKLRQSAVGLIRLNSGSRLMTNSNAVTAGIPREISPMEVVSIPPRTKLQIVLLTETNYFLSTNRGSFIPRYHVPGGAQGARDSKQD